MTAVLENWQDVENAIDIYANSAGSAMRENEIYLDSWEAKSKALSASWNEFVNTFLNADMFKGFIEGATSVLKFLTDINGMMPILIGFLAGGLYKAIFSIIGAVKAFTVALAEAGTVAALSTGGLSLLIGAIVTVAGGLISWGVSASDTSKQIEKLNTKIQEQQTEIDKLTDKEKDVVDLYKEYESLISKSKAYGLNASEKENLLNISKELVDTYGLEVSGIDEVTGAYIVGASAVNQYVEALRKERLEKEQDQTKTRNDRINKNIGLIKKAQGSEGDYKEARELLPKFEHYREDLQKLIDEIDNEDISIAEEARAKYSELLSEIQDEIEWMYLNEEIDLDGTKAYMIIDELLGLSSIDSNIFKYSSEASAKVNSVVKDILTNIQVDNADILDSNSESLLTQVLTPYLTTVNWDEFDKDGFETKVKDFVTQHKDVIDKIVRDSAETNKNISSDKVSINDYKKYIENQTAKANVLASIIGGEEGKKEAQKIIDDLSNSFGSMMAEISNILGENSGVFDEFTTQFLRLEQKLVSGEITFKEYTDGINKSLKSLDIEKTFGDSEESIKSFFSTMQTKGENILKNIATEFQTGKKSLEDYMSDVEQVSGYFISLGDKAVSALGEDSPISRSIKESSNNLSELLKELKLVQSAVKESSVSFEDFKKKPISSIESLVNKLLDLGITVQDLGGDATDSAKDIAKSLQSDTEAFAKMQTALATKTQSVLAQIGGSIGKILSGVKEYIKGFKVRFNVDLNPFDGNGIGIEPEVSGSAPVDYTDKKEYADRVAGIKRDSSGKITNGWTQTKQDEFNKALKASDDEVYFGNLLSNSIDGNSLSEFISGLDSGDNTLYTPTNSGKDGDKPEYEDPTDAIINRINLRANELEQQEEYIQNALEIAEIENDYEKQISLTNDLIANRKKRVEELNKANAGLHNKAEYLRNSNPWDEESWFNNQGEATEVYYNLYNTSSKEEQEKIKNLFESLSKYKKAYMDNAEEIVGLNKEILQNEKSIADLRWENSNNWIDERNTKGDWSLYGDSEYEAWQRVVKWLKEKYPKELDKIHEAEQNAIDANFQHSVDWINDRNTYNDWELYGDNEVAAWERVLKRFQTEYPNELEKIKEIEENIFNARKEAMEKSIDDIEDYIDARNTYNDWDAYGDSEIKVIERQTKIIQEEYKQRLISREEYIKKLEEQSERIYSLAQEEIDKNLSNIDKYIDARNHYNDWDEFGDSEIDAIKRQIQYLDAAYNQKLISYEDYTERVAGYTQKMYSVAKDNIIKEVSELIEDYEEMKGLESSQLNSQKTLLQSYYDVTNAIAEAQHEINKELEASMSMYEYLDEDTRKLLFNQEDYEVLSKELLDIQTAANELQKQYQEDILNANAETIAEITSQYEMQYSTMMKQYEIAKAELEVAKKRQKLDNVLAERNTRMFINGQWQWVAKTQDVINAQNELADAEIERKKQEASLEQTEAINDFTAQINSLETDLNKTKKWWSDMQEMLDGESEEVAEALRQISNVSSPELKRVIQATGGSISSFSGFLSDSTSTMSEVINSNLSGITYGVSGFITNLTTYSNAILNMAARISGVQTSDSPMSVGNTYKVNPDGKAPSGLKVGDKVVTAGGTYEITGVNSDGSYKSTLVDSSTTTSNYKGSYANATSGSSSSGSSSSSSSGSSSSSSSSSKQVNTTDQYVNSGGVIQSNPNWDGKKKGGVGSFYKYAVGTRYTAGGLTALGEEGFEAYITNNGRLIPINQPTIGNIGAGGVVFNREQMANLRNLWDLSNLSKVSPFVSSSNANNQSTVIDNSIHINGLTVSEQGNEDWINGLKRYVATHK